MNKEKYDELKKMYSNYLKEFKNKKEKIEYLEDIEFSINMIDRWDDDDRIAIKVIGDLMKEVKKGE